MNSWLVGHWPLLGGVAVKAVLMYLTALVGLRVSHRRTLAEWTAMDFVAAVAVGAIVGRTAIAGEQSYIFGAVALATIFTAHWLLAMGRRNEFVARLTDHRVRVLVADGRLRRRQLLLCGLTENDVYAHLRQRGVLSLSQVRYLLYETKGGLTVVVDDPAPSGTSPSDTRTSGPRTSDTRPSGTRSSDTRSRDTDLLDAGLRAAKDPPPGGSAAEQREQAAR